MIRVNLSDRTLLTLIIPGAILLIAMSLALWPHLWPAVDVVLNALEVIRTEKSLDTAVLFAALLAVGVLIAYVMALLVGALIAVAVGYIEFRVLDVWASPDFPDTFGKLTILSEVSNGEKAIHGGVQG